MKGDRVSDAQWESAGKLAYRKYAERTTRLIAVELIVGLISLFRGSWVGLSGVWSGAPCAVMADFERIGRVVKLLLSACIILALVWCPAFSAVIQPESELSLSVTMITGEHSRDANSTTISLMVSGNDLTYEQSYHGAHSGKREPVKRVYRLSNEERGALISLLKEKHLVVKQKMSSVTEGAMGRYFQLLIHSKLDAKEGSITIEGPRSSTKLKGERLYQDSMYLVEQLFQLLRKTDPDLAIPKLID